MFVAAFYVISFSSAIILLTGLLQQIVIQFDDSVTEGEAFVLDCIGD
jgi:hypothetical protein